LKRLLLFYIVNTPCEKLSSSSIPLSKYLWKKNVWQFEKNGLKAKLFSICNIVAGITYFKTRKLDGFKEILERSEFTGEKLFLFLGAFENGFLKI
jgi:hypothetical protein